MKIAPKEALSLKMDGNISVSMLNLQQVQHLFVETMFHTINTDFLFSFLSAENMRLNQRGSSAKKHQKKQNKKKTHTHKNPNYLQLLIYELQRDTSSTKHISYRLVFQRYAHQLHDVV